MTEVSRLRRLVYLLLFLWMLVLAGVVDLHRSVNDLQKRAAATNAATHAANLSLEAQRQTSERNECRAEVASAYTSSMWFDLANVIEKSFNGDRVGAQLYATSMVQRQPIQEQVDAKCPKPIG